MDPADAQIPDLQLRQQLVVRIELDTIPDDGKNRARLYNFLKRPRWVTMPLRICGERTQGGAQGKELIKEYRSKKGSLTASKDDRAIRRIFRMYDEDKDGSLNKIEALNYLRDLLAAAGLAEQIWDDAVQADDPDAYFDEVVRGIFSEINKKNKDALELEDMIAMTSTSMKLQDILNDVSERLEESWRAEMFKKALLEDIEDMKTSYKDHKFIKEVKYSEETRKVLVSVRHADLRATLSVLLPEDFPFGHPRPAIKFNEDNTDPDHADLLEELERELSKTCKMSDIGLVDVVEAFVKGFSEKFKIGVVANVKELQKKKEKSAWRTQSRDASAVREVRVEFTRPIDTDMKEASALFGSHSVSHTGTTDVLRLRFDAFPLDDQIAKLLDIKDKYKEYAAITITFHPNYTHIGYPPLVKPVKKSKLKLSASQIATDVSLNDRFSEVIATVAQQFLQHRWTSINTPDKWELNRLINPKSGLLKKKTVQKVEFEHAMRALTLSQYDIEFARELLEAALSSSSSADNDEVDDTPSESSSSSVAALTAAAPAPPPITLTKQTVQVDSLPGNANYFDPATPWLTKLGVWFKCDQCGTQIRDVVWICTICHDYDLCDTCHGQGWETYERDHKYSHPMAAMRWRSTESRFRLVDPEATTVETYTCMSRANACLLPGKAQSAIPMKALAPSLSNTQHAGASFDSSSADAASMIEEIKAVSAPNSAKQKKLATLASTAGASQLAMSEALLAKKMNPLDAIHLYLDAGGALDNVENLQILEQKHDPDKLATMNTTNILVEILVYVTQRLKRLRGFCLMCGQRIVLDIPVGAASSSTSTAASSSYVAHSDKMLCCTKATCQFQHIEMKHMFGVPIEIVPASISSDIINNEDIVDLFLCLAYSATSSRVNNREKVFDPSPPFITGSSRFDNIHSLIDSIPKVSSMRQHAEDGETQLRRYLNGQSPNIYPFLHWLLHVKRGVLVKIPPKRRISEFKTDNQFLMLAGTDPDRRVQFNEWRAQFGSYFAFHGSSAENWHSILRNGLRNLSGTALQRNGAAYGSGVYMAKDSQTSFSYSKVGSNWCHSKFGTSSLLCLAIAEVAKAPGVPVTPNPYYVVREDQYIMTRFFLFYDRNTGESATAESLHLERFFEDEKVREKPPAHLLNKGPL